MLALLIAVPAQATTPTATATVSRTTSGFEVEYRVKGKSRAWVFPVSATTQANDLPWRARAWRVLTPGVRIERRGAYDVITSAGPIALPKRIRIAFSPTSATLEREYDPAVSFSNGAVALYSDQFDIAPVNDLTAIDATAAGASIKDFRATSVAIRFHDVAGPVFVHGQRKASPVLAGAETYVVFGAGKVEEVRGVAMLADPALPKWLKADIAGFAPHVASTYTARLGKRTESGMPLLLLGWRGPTPGKVINDGGVRPGQILFNFEGEGLIDRNEQAARRSRWFIAHEMAHFWLGTSGVAYRTPADAWITEGGADMMALTLIAATDRSYALSELQRAVDDCVKYASRPIATAVERRESRAYYACGTVFALVATKRQRAAGSTDYFDFIRPLLNAHRSDRVVDASQWLAHLTKVCGDAESSDGIRSILDNGSVDPAQTIAELLENSRIAFKRNGAAIVLAPTAISGA